MLAGRLAQSDRTLDATEGVLHGHRLRTAGLHVLFGAAAAGQQVGRLAVDEMTVIELGGDLHRQVHLDPGRFHGRSLGNGADKIAAEPEERLHLPARMPSQASTVFMPFSRGGSKPNCFAYLSSGTSSGFSEMPTVR